MKSFNYKSKYHYIVKYFVIAFPLIFVLVLSLIDLISFSDYIDVIDSYPSSLNESVNSWYFNIIDLLGLRVIFENGGLWSYLLVYPLYVFWVYVFDLILDVFTIIPKLAHKFLNRLGGDKYE